MTNVLKTTELYPLKWLILFYVNFTSTKTSVVALKVPLGKKRKRGKLASCQARCPTFDPSEIYGDGMGPGIPILQMRKWRPPRNTVYSGTEEQGFA